MRIDDAGTIRISPTRITLDTVVEVFNAGHSAEEIVLQFPSLSLAGVYATIAYYLNNREAVDRYMTDGVAKGAAAIAKLEAMPGNKELRERLLGLKHRKESA
jgi:uncharacterized protein (DUF433 family)